jgi:predicted TIM-barrel fold metal-dependent hydrolase
VSATFAIVDAHQHFWDPTVNYHPWLCDPTPIPFRYGDYTALRRPYQPADYLVDAGEVAVTATVYVETEWDPRDPVGEMRYVERLRRETGLPTVAVAGARLDGDDAAAVLERQAAFPFVRSIRHKPRANAAPGGTAPGELVESRWRRGFARLARHGLRFDLQTPWWHLPEAARLARDFPDTTIILNHTGLPADRSPEGFAGWRAALGEFARCPNVAVKISGLGVPGTPWTAEANRAIVLTAIDLFGVRRSMFASNFPVDSLCASFVTIFSGFRAIVADFSVAEQRALFVDNALRVYAITLPLAAPEPRGPGDPGRDPARPRREPLGRPRRPGRRRS